MSAGDGGFEEFNGPVERLPVAFSSAEWYAGKLEHLPMGWIQTQAGADKQWTFRKPPGLRRVGARRGVRRM